MSLNYLASLSHFVPELLACLTMCALIVLEATYSNNEKNKPLLFNSAYLGLGSVAVILLLNLNKQGIAIFTNSIIVDPFSTLMKVVMVLGTIGSIYLCKVSKDLKSEVKAEYAIIASGVLVGGMILSSANNLLILYIAIETLSILSYVLASMKKNDERSSEAGLKYSLYGGISAGLMLYGMSHIFGVLGTISYPEMAVAIKSLSTESTLFLMPAFVLFLAGLGYKIACVPFHMWTPDVYEGSPLPVTTFFSIVPKVAAIAAIVRVTTGVFGTEGMLQVSWVGLISVIAALTMTVGNVSAIGQRSVKRMLAYSSISHAGVMLLGVVVVNEIGVRAIVFYGITYLFMTLVAFYIVNFVNDKYKNDHFERFSGLITKHPLMAIMLTIVMFSLAGIPPFSGFIAKFNILAAIVAKKYYVLAIIAGLNSVVSIYYYLKIVRLMILKDSESNEGVEGFSIANQLIIVSLTVPVLALGIFWEKILNFAINAQLYVN